MKMHEIFTIAKKEFMDNWRNKWILAISAIFLILTLVISYFGSLGNKGWQDLEGTIGGMMALVQFLVPILGLMLGYASISGERERGSLMLLLSYPVTRLEVLVGKFFGLGMVISLANVIGFGIASVVIGINVRGVQWGDFAIFILASILLGLVFIAISLLFSSVFKKRSTSLGGAILIWFFFSMIWSIILSGIIISKYGFDVVADENWVGPTWYYVASIINPISAFSVLVALNITPIQTNIVNLPSFYTTPVMLAILSIYIILSIALAHIILARKDM